MHCLQYFNQKLAREETAFECLIAEWILILKLCIEGQGAGYKLDSAGSGQGSMVDLCDHGNERSVPIKGKESFCLISDYRILL